MAGIHTHVARLFKRRDVQSFILATATNDEHIEVLGGNWQSKEFMEEAVGARWEVQGRLDY